MSTPGRRYPVGAELTGPAEASLRLWAPDRATVDVTMDGVTRGMRAEGGGYFVAEVPARAGSRYGFRLAGDDRLYPDPASRWQPDGPEAGRGRAFRCRGR